MHKNPQPANLLDQRKNFALRRIRASVIDDDDLEGAMGKRLRHHHHNFID
jgi:hypothetical protein